MLNWYMAHISDVDVSDCDQPDSDLYDTDYGDEEQPVTSNQGE